jgi:RNA polymerase sigma-70 factor (ECF subfamily)
MPHEPPYVESAAHFSTTNWSQVLAAGQQGLPEARDALTSLCRTYWYPLYAFVRRSGYQPDDAQDLTQAFFMQLLEKDYLRAVDRARGRFRSFLLAAFQHFVSKERDRARAQKRGGGKPTLPLDFAAGEQRYSLEPAHEQTAEKAYERRWAMMLLDQVLARLQQEFVQAGDETQFDALKGFLTGEDTPYHQVAESLGTTEGAVKTAVHRLRRRYRDLIVAEISQTVSSPEEVDEELRHLLIAVRADN